MSEGAERELNLRARTLTVEDVIAGVASDRRYLHTIVSSVTFARGRERVTSANRLPRLLEWAAIGDRDCRHPNCWRGFTRIGNPGEGLTIYNKTER